VSAGKHRDLTVDTAVEIADEITDEVRWLGTACPGELAGSTWYGNSPSHITRIEHPAQPGHRVA
jgi:hypothetical protein